VKLLLTALVLAGFALPASAQTVNPTTLAFTASVDHNDALHYVMEVYRNGLLVRTTNLGKPIPTTEERISVALVQDGLAKNAIYTLYVTTVGPGGSARSDVSTQFCWAKFARNCN
jgi:hypothetical protein